MRWMDWINTNWSELKQGKKICVHQDQICHPTRHPELFKVGLGFPDGQTCDYMMPLDDKSRIHVQCYADKSGEPMFRVHRDRWDPDRDLGSLVMHAIFETPFGPVLGGAALLGIFASK